MYPVITPEYLFYEVKRSSLHRYGVFARIELKAGMLIEVSPVVVLPDQLPDELGRYAFSWPMPDGSAGYALALGVGSLFNHGPNGGNAYWEVHPDTDTLRFIARHRILPDEEILIDYGEEYWANTDRFRSKPMGVVYGPYQPKRP
jgi:tRNA-specific adenosine deaminase 3